MNFVSLKTFFSAILKKITDQPGGLQKEIS